jgi:hypothetical protein
MGYRHSEITWRSIGIYSGQHPRGFSRIVSQFDHIQRKLLSSFRLYRSCLDEKYNQNCQSTT